MLTTSLVQKDNKIMIPLKFVYLKDSPFPREISNNPMKEIKQSFQHLTWESLTIGSNSKFQTKSSAFVITIEM